ncbi:MAG: hypothetical protein VX745_10680, partial [Pseudomonadota bacterium]|nr:hypothetical protein [Pseudomonadota bacterium]
MSLVDIQRVLILVGLAATAYLLILAWNEDYGGETSVPVTLGDAPYDAVGELAESELPRGMLPDPQSQIPQLETKNGLDVPELALTQPDIQQVTQTRLGR